MTLYYKNRQGAGAQGASLGKTVAMQQDRPTLTSRQVAVLDLVVRGQTNAQIGRHLGISSRTVRAHLRYAYITLGTSNRVTAAVAWVQRRRPPEVGACSPSAAGA